ncbi:MAG: aminotransferase class IV [Alphaproteobacteria bacterium]|nr:aminotransferase class IV [Alphaproteobacteria bacterium]MCW5740750.1 aminotransferase class IV [Alphaproteobacteria bacterium]
MSIVEANTSASDALIPSGVAFADGAYMPVEQLSVSALDYGFTRSDVTYDVVHVWNGSFFRLEHHLDRFTASMARLRLDPGHDRAALRAILMECVRRTGLREAYVAMVCTRGRPPPGVRDIRQCRNRFMAYAIPFVWIASEEKQRTGLSAVIASRPRIPAVSVDPTVKNYHWLDMEMSLFEAYDAGADTVILPSLEGTVTEGPGFNVFAVRDGTVLTPDSGVLEGITRGAVIDLCRRGRIPIEVRPVTVAEFRDADEIFAASTAGGVMPVTKLDGRILGNGAPGALTSRIRELYWAWHQDPGETTPVAYA